MISKLVLVMSFIMAGVMSFFNPLTVNHGNQGCCAECTLKKEEEVELVYEDEEDKKEN